MLKKTLVLFTALFLAIGPLAMGTSFAVSTEQTIEKEANAASGSASTTGTTETTSGNTAADQTSADETSEGTTIDANSLEDFFVSTDEKTTFGPLFQKAAVASSYVNLLFTPLISFFANHIGGFLGTDYIYGAEMGTMLKGIWTVSRNIVNVAFVIILLALAIGQIFGEPLGSEISLKKSLPKFVLTLVLVNFTWLGCKLLIDAGNVAANVVFAIPAGVKGVIGDAVTKKGCDVGTDGIPRGLCVAEKGLYQLGAKFTLNYNLANCPGGPEKKKLTPEDIDAKLELEKIGAEGGFSVQGGGQVTGITDTSKLNSKNVNVLCWQTIDYAKYSKSNAALYLAYGMAKIQNLGRASFDGSAAKALIGATFGFALQVIFLASLVSLFVVVIIRTGMLWVFVAFSPFLVLMWMLQEVSHSIHVPEQFSLPSLLKWAFVPAMMGVTLVVGFLMLLAGETVDVAYFQNGTGNVVSDFSTLFGGMESLQELIWLVITTYVFFKAAETATHGLPMAGAVVEKIMHATQGAATIAGKAATAGIPVGVTYDQSGQAHTVTMGKALSDFRQKTKEFEEGGLGGNQEISQLAKVLEKFKTGPNHDRLQTAINNNNTVEIAELLREIKSDLRGKDAATITAAFQMGAGVNMSAAQAEALMKPI